MNKEKDFLVSVVCPVKETDNAVLTYLRSLVDSLKANYDHYEVVLIQDGIPFEDDKLTSFVKSNSGCRLLTLVRGYGVDVAITAGLESAIGDVVVICLPPFDPTDRIVDFVNTARSGYIGIGQKPAGHHENVLRLLSKKIFYFFVNKILDLKLPSDTTYFVSFPRQAVTYIQRVKDKFRFLKVVTAQTGLPFKLITYEPSQQDGRLYRTFWESIVLSIDVATSQSLKILRFASVLGVLLSLVALLYVIYAINIFIFKSNVQSGWSSLSIFMAAGFFLIGLISAIVTEYLAKLFAESVDRPIYTIANETMSSKSAVANTHIGNVLNTSEIE